MSSPGTDTARIRASSPPRRGAPRFRHVRIPASVVDLLYDDSDIAPAWQERRLERHLARMFPEGCGLDLVADVAWSETDDAWGIRRARVAFGMSGDPDATRSLIDSLRAEGLPIIYL